MLLKKCLVLTLLGLATTTIFAKPHASCREVNGNWVGTYKLTTTISTNDGPMYCYYDVRMKGWTYPTENNVRLETQLYNGRGSHRGLSCPERITDVFPGICENGYLKLTSKSSIFGEIYSDGTMVLANVDLNDPNNLLTIYKVS